MHEQAFIGWSLGATGPTRPVPQVLDGKLYEREISMVRGTSCRLVFAIAFIAPVLGSGRAQGHEIKVLLDRMSPKQGDQDVVYLSWGHLLPIDRPTRGEDIERYQLRTPSGSRRQLTLEGESDQRNTVHLDESGIYTAEAVRKPAILTIYRVGKQHIHFLGPKTKVRKGATIEESFRSFQSAKAIVATDGGAEAPAPIGHPLEIVPAVGPQEWRVGRDIPFQVLFEGKAISGKPFQAKPIHFKPDDVWTWTRPTDQDGRAVLRPDGAGVWLLRVVVDRPGPEADRADFDVDQWTATLVLDIREKE
jgi:uncharacterized GH25 family protein